MLNFDSKLRVVALALWAFGFAMPAYGQELPEFDCKELLRAANFDDAATLDEGGKGQMYLKLGQGEPVPKPEDPVSLTEILGDEKQPLLARSIGTDDYGPWPMSCNLIIVEFSVTDQLDAALTLIGSEGEELGIRLPILLVGQVGSSTAEQNKFDEWKKNGFSIPVNFEAFDEDRKTQLTAEVFGTVSYFSSAAWDSENVQFSKLDNPPNAVRDFLEKNRAIKAGQMIVLCGTSSCEDTAYKAVRSQSATMDPPPDEAETEFAGPQAPPADTTKVAPEEVVPDPEPAPEPALPVVSNSIKMEAEVSFVGKNGEESAEGLESFSFACILSAVSDDIFEEPPVCDNPAFAGLKDRATLIRVGDSGRLQLVAGARFPDASSIEVTLPTGQVGTSCMLSISYLGKDGQQMTVILEPVASGTPGLFVANIATPPQRGEDGKSVQIELISTGEAECGGPSRVATVESSETLQVPLRAQSPVRRAILHTLLMNMRDLESELRLGQETRHSFGQAVLDALEAAHARTAATQGNAAWGLVSANVATLDATGQVIPLVKLSASNLRGRVAEEFDVMTSDQRDAISQSLVSTASGPLVQALLPSVQEAGSKGRIDHIMLTLIAPVVNHTEAGLGDPCSDPTFLDLPASLTETNGPTVGIAVFPLIKLRPDDQVDLARLRPLTQDDDAPSLPGGLYACRDTKPGIAIYPFYVEPWRTPVDFTPRFGTALSDQIGEILQTLLPDDEVSN